MSERAWAIYAALIDCFGEPRFEGGEEPIAVLVGTILSANTTDANSSRAFNQLMTAFGSDWDAIRTAPLDEIKAAIRPAGMYHQKAPHIVATLERIKTDRGDYALGFLAALPAAEALRYLTALPGVGHKTASIVLLFCFNGAAFPVDTHIQRISQRLGVAAPKESAEKIKGRWESLLPPQTYYALHVNLIRLGHEICQARQPRCEVCPLQAYCDYYGRSQAGGVTLAA